MFIPKVNGNFIPLSTVCITVRFFSFFPHWYAKKHTSTLTIKIKGRNKNYYRVHIDARIILWNWIEFKNVKLLFFFCLHKSKRFIVWTWQLYYKLDEQQQLVVTGITFISFHPYNRNWFTPIFFTSHWNVGRNTIVIYSEINVSRVS